MCVENAAHTRLAREVLRTCSYKTCGKPRSGGHSPAREDGASGAGAWLSENSGENRNQPEIERRRILRGIHLSIVFLKLVDISALNVILSLFLCMA